MKTILYNPIFINPQAYYVFPRLTRYLQPDNESTAEPANYIGTIEVKVIAYGDTTLKRTYTNTDSIDLSEFKNTWIRISLFTKVGSCVLGEWKIGNMESDLPYIDPEVLASLKAVVIVGNKTNNDSDRAIVKNLVDPDNPFVISNAAYTEGSGYADKDSPYYGAFVTDGVDDLITSTKTVQEMLGGSNEITVVSMIHQIDGNVNYTNGYTNYIRHGGGFIRNLVAGKDGKGLNKTGIYGYTSTQLDSSNMGLGNVINNILGDKDDYSFERSSTYTLDDAKYSVQNFVNANNQPSNEGSSIAWYWTIIANKVLTTDQINQVIAYFNLDRTLRPDIYCNIAKQEITNENHAEFGDKLIDFSGNGRDIQLNNIAWDGDSGIGKYNYPNWKVNVTQGNKYARIVYYDSINGTYSANFKGITDLYKSYGLSIEIRVNRANTIDFHSIKEDGIYTITPPDDTTSMDIRFGGEDVYNASCNITITQIPSHAGALCLDGVNDFGKVTGMPIYKDYTFIIEREFLNETFPNQVCLVSKSKVASEIENGGAFIVDNISVNSIINPYSFYKTTSLPGLNTFDRQIVFQSKYKYLDKDIAAGTATDSDTLWLGTFRDNDSRFANVAIYSLMSFPYSMSEFLIERQLKKHKLGTLYPNMVEFRPIVKSNNKWDIIEIWQGDKSLYRPAVNDDKTGIYLKGDSTIGIYVKPKDADEVTKIVVNGTEYTNLKINSNGFYYVTLPITKSPQKINITIDEYIRYEDIVQPYPVLLRFNDENGNEVSWGGKFRVGSTITRIGSAADSNLLPNIYNIFGLLLNDNQVTSSKVIVEKTMVFKAKSAYIFDNNEPKCILSPSRLRIPNSSYKLLGYIPDISGHGNHGVIHNSAYAEGSGVNEDGSYQFDGVDDFVTIPTVTGGKQVLMKVNWQSIAGTAILYDQRTNGGFAIFNRDYDTNENKVPAYRARNIGGNTYIDGILNEYIYASQLQNITHNIVELYDPELNIGTLNPKIGSSYLNSNYAQMSLYDFMLFDNISTDDKIKELNDYVGIEAKVELPPYYWDAYGKTNLDADKATIQQRGVAVGDYDLTNYNHAYDKMSGYGGYSLGRFDKSWSSSSSNNTSVIVVSRNPYDITLKKLGGNSDWEFNNTELKVISNPVSVKFKSNKNIRVTCDYHYYPVGGNSEGTPLGITSKDLIANKDAIITISPISQENIDKYNIDVNRGYYLIYFQLSSTLAVNEEVTIEMLPLYPNGLVYDGVTDYSENVNIPALTDFTYVFKRKLLDNVAGCASMTKGLTDQQRAVVIDYINTTGGINGTSFGNMAFVPSLRDSDIIYSTTTNINGTTITKGNNPDSNGIDIGKFATYYKKMVFYKLILYPKTIPLLQINFLKNLMERDEIIDLNNKIFIQE